MSATVQSWLFPSQYHQHQALRWWHQRQRDRLHRGAELIREGVLQDLFALRRQMEVAHYSNQPVSSQQLQQLETLYTQLKHLGHELSPTFSQDSLSLAIQGILLQWRSPHRKIEWAMHASAAALDGTMVTGTAWSRESPSTSALVPNPTIHPILVTVLEEWLRLVTVQLGDKAVIGVELLSRDHQGDLTLRLQEPDDERRRAIAHTQELSYLCHAFEVLTDGKATQRHHDIQLKWQFLWPLSGSDRGS